MILTPEGKAAETAALQAALTTASGSVRVVAVLLGCSEKTLHTAITALGLRPWLTSTYSRSDRQPRARGIPAGGRAFGP